MACLLDMLGFDEESKTLLFTGHIQGDGYSTYEALVKRFQGIILAGCTAHLRRKFSKPANKHLFMGSAESGKDAALFYTLIENCKRHGLDLQGYLKQAMQMLVEHGAGRAAEFTPVAVVQACRTTKAS